MLPPIPIVAFFLLVNGGYLAAFTAAGGQTIGKMAFGLKVVGHADLPVSAGPSIVRTFGCLLSIASLGLGFAAGASRRRRPGASKIVSPTRASSGCRPEAVTRAIAHDATCALRLHVRRRRLFAYRARHGGLGGRPGGLRRSAAAWRVAGSSRRWSSRVIVAAGVWSGTIAERHFGSTDPGPGVIDEVAGMLVTLYALPAGWVMAIAGFFLFRVLDVFKPLPAQRFERLHGGLGMMADDLMVAIYGNLLLRVALWLAARPVLRLMRADRQR